jgi:hypothetical protein
MDCGGRKDFLPPPFFRYPGGAIVPPGRKSKIFET